MQDFFTCIGGILTVLHCYCCHWTGLHVNTTRCLEAVLPPRSPLHGRPVQLVPHPQSITDRGVVQGQEEHLGAVGQVLHQAAQGRLGAPQALQEPGLVGEGVDDERSPQDTRLVAELSIQSPDHKRVGDVSRLRPADPEAFSGSQTEGVVVVVAGPTGLFISD